MSDIKSKHEPISDDPVLAKEPYTLFEPGTYPATVAKTLDLGVIDSGFGPQSTIEVGFNVDYKGKIVLYSRRFNNTAHRTGNLFKLTSALGVEMEKGFHFRQMIGKPFRCTVTDTGVCRYGRHPTCVGSDPGQLEDSMGTL